MSRILVCIGSERVISFCIKNLSTFFKKIISYKNLLKTFLFSLVFLISSSFAYAANIVLQPSSGSYSAGSTFSVNVSISGNTDPINGVSANITFSNDTLELTSISKTGSIMTMWAQEPTFSNGSGQASFEGVIFNPGFNGSQGKVVALNFRAKKSGTGTVTLTGGSVLANDGNATNVLGTLGSATFNIGDSDTKEVPVAKKTTTTSSLVPVITSSSYPDSEKWYSKRDASFEWKIPSGVTAVRTLYDDKEDGTPNKVYDPPINNRSFTVDGDGIMYMHVQFKSGSGWGQISSYKFQIDKDSPETLKASFPDGSVTNNPTPAILIVAEDKLSGIDHITMTIDGSDPISYEINSSNIYKLPKQISGKHTVVITAFDKAENSSDVSLDYTIQTISVPVITEYTKSVEVGGTLKVVGTTYPDSVVEVSLVDKEGNSESQTTTADDGGIFNLSWSKKLESGRYDLKARAVNQKGALSEYSDAKTVIVENIPLIRFGIFIMNWLSLILLFIISTFAIVATFWFSFNQFGRFRRKVHRTLLEAENTLKTNVQGLRRDTEEFHTLLVKAERKRALTKEEQTILRKFKKRLDTVEKEIEDKLEAIG